MGDPGVSTLGLGLIEQGGATPGQFIRVVQDGLSLTLLQTCRQCVDRDGVPFKGYYVTADGSVISTKQGQPRRMRPTRSGNKLYVPLRVNAATKTVFLHALVACAWLGLPPTPRHRVYHVDRIRTNNTASNLRWAMGTVDRPMIPEEQIETVLQLRGEGKTLNQIADATGRRQRHDWAHRMWPQEL